MSGAKGAARERETVRRFAAAGWGALRLPSSGSATDRELPDVLAGRPHVTTEHTLAVDENPTTYTDAVAIELKSGQQPTLYVDAAEVDALETFAAVWGATAYLGARFTFDSGPHYNTTETFLVRPNDARRTDSGLYGLPVDTIRERAAYAVSADAVERL